MLTSFLLPLVLGPALFATPATRSGLPGDPPIRIRMSSDGQYEPGDRARVQIETRDDGYVLVLNRDSEGRLRVLFPIDPREENFVRGGHRYEVRGRRDDESFIVGASGEGLIYAAVSADPFRLAEFDSQGNWDYSALSIDVHSADPERDISELLQRVATSRGFDYDLAAYTVSEFRV